MISVFPLAIGALLSTVYLVETFAVDDCQPDFWKCFADELPHAFICKILANRWLVKND
jgi:hypothetical protein